MSKLIIAMGVLLTGGGALWLFSQYPGDSYEYGYAAAFVEADRLWWVTMPPDSVCDHVAAAGAKSDALLNYAEIVHGCQSGFYDAVTHTRGRLGYPPLP